MRRAEAARKADRQADRQTVGTCSSDSEHQTVPEAKPWGRTLCVCLQGKTWQALALLSFALLPRAPSFILRLLRCCGVLAWLSTVIDAGHIISHLSGVSLSLAPILALIPIASRHSMNLFPHLPSHSGIVDTATIPQQQGAVVHGPPQAGASGSPGRSEDSNSKCHWNPKIGHWKLSLIRAKR